MALLPQAIAVGSATGLNIITSLAASAQTNALTAQTQSVPALYRPPQWSSQVAKTSIIVPAANGGQQSYLVFDAVFRAQHNTSFTKTLLPVQTGSAISDHIYINPARIVLEIGMSDAFDSYAADMWTGNSSKSVNAYETILALAQARTPFTLNTRLKSYSNVTIDDIRSTDDARTMNGLRMEIQMSETFIAQIVTQVISARPQTSNATPQGTLQAQPATPTQIDNHAAGNALSGYGGDSSSGVSAINGVVPTSLDENLNYQLPGAGNYTSGVQ